ncbi:MAG: hypothetical protein KME64_09855 [Scytonematopsis contorta HA4267-MV1]|nr:hypothetical protein [Scytonematopsis contorta HA4267-MV1]
MGTLRVSEADATRTRSGAERLRNFQLPTPHSPHSQLIANCELRIANCFSTLP